MELGLGNIEGSALGERGVTKRLGALARLDPLKGDRLLDIGCANGTYTMILAEGYAETHAIDIEPQRLAAFDQRLEACAVGDRIWVWEMSAQAMTFPEGSFDTITAIEVLEHVPDLDRTLDECHRVLRPTGRLLITGPNRYFPFETHGWVWKGQRRSPVTFPFLPWIQPIHRHLADARSFTVRSLTRRVERHGFARTGFTYLMPPFDRKLARLRGLDRLETGPLRFIGLTLVLSFDRLR